MNLQKNYDSLKNGKANTKLLLRRNINIDKKNLDVKPNKLKHLSIRKFQKKDHSKDGSLKGKDLLLKRLNSASSKISTKLSLKLASRGRKKNNESLKNKDKNDSKKISMIPRSKQIQLKNKSNIKKKFKFGRSNDNLQGLQINKQQTSVSPTLKNLRNIRKKTSGFDFGKHLEELKQKNLLNKQNSQTTQDQSQTKNLQPKVKEFQFKKLHFSKKSIELRPKTNTTVKKLEHKKSQGYTTKTNKVKLMSKHIKLEKKINFKARSIEFKKRQKVLKTNITKHVKNFLSEDKDKEDFMHNQEKPKLNRIHHPEQLKVVPSRGRSNNRYYQYLKKKLKDRFAQELQKKIKNSFKNWSHKDHAEFYKKFQTSIAFYEIKNMIGQGCFGKVYLANQALTGRQVALKVIARDNIKKKENQKKIQKEVRILKRINHHKGVIKLYEVFKDQGFVYMVFEFAEKGDLVQYFKINPLLDEPILRPFFRKILESVQYIHKNQIIHRDIKLDNILLDKDKNPKICDFGISSEFDKKEIINDTGGTPAYLAPEVIRNQGEISLKSDMWSLGVLLYLLGFGRVPFQAKNIQSLYGRIILGQYDIPRQEYLSNDFSDLIKKLLTVNHQKRLNIDQALNHRWFNKQEAEQQLNVKTNEQKEKERLKIEAINYYLQDIGFPQSYIQQTFQKNLFNHVKACTDALYNKFGIQDQPL